MSEMTANQPALQRGPAIWHKVYGDNPEELEQAALAVAAEFFGAAAPLEVDRRWNARRTGTDVTDGTGKAYTATIYVHVMEPVEPSEAARAAERICRELAQT